MALDESKEKEVEASEAKEELDTKKDLEIDEEPTGEVEIEDPSGDEDVAIEEGPQMPHGAHVLHDMHDFYGAGHGVASEHLKLLDNDRVKEMVADHADQLNAMAGELRELFGQEYPDHPAPEGAMTEESETPGEEFLEENEDEDIDPADEHEEEKDMDEDDLDEKSQTAKSTTTTKKAATAGANTEKSLTPADRRMLDRKQERLETLYADEIGADGVSDLVGYWKDRALQAEASSR